MYGLSSVFMQLDRSAPRGDEVSHVLLICSRTDLKIIIFIYSAKFSTNVTDNI